MTDPSRQIISEASLNEARPAKIAETFAPVVWLHKDDQYRPSSVAWYLKRASLEYKNNKQKILAEGSVTAESLINQEVLLSQEEGFDYSDFTKPLSNRNQKVNLKITNVDSIMNGDLTTATCYVHIRPTLDIQYWFFYPYNGAIAGSGAHEGDWEHITIRFRVANPTAKGDIKAIYFSRHEETVWIKNEEKKIEFEGNRPVIFSAFHTHANYSTPYQGAIDECNRGLKWETWSIGGRLEFLEDYPPAEDPTKEVAILGIGLMATGEGVRVWSLLLEYVEHMGGILTSEPSGRYAGHDRGF